MKSKNGNNSNNVNEKYNKKQINNISNRIRSLEKDINRLKNNDLLFNKKFIDNNRSIIIDKNNNTMISNNSKLITKRKYTISQKNCIKNYLFNNDNKKINSNNHSFSEKKLLSNSKKKNSKIYKKMNNYHSLIHEKKNNLLNYKSHFNKRKSLRDKTFKDFSKISLTKHINSNKNIFKIDYINEQNKFYNRKIQSEFNINDKIHHFMSVDKINTNFEKNNKIINDLKDNCNNNAINDMGQLEYEFEIRHLIKKKNILKEKNKEMIEKLKEIKNKNIINKNNIFKRLRNNQIILENLVIFNKNYRIHNLNRLENCETINNKSISDDYSLKNIILNIMDIKFDYENNILFNNFIEGINELLNIPLINNNNFNDNIIKKITELSNINKNLKRINNEYKIIFLENNKFLKNFKKLLSDLNIESFEQFYDFVQNIFIKNVAENERMNQIKKALINESKPNSQRLLEEKINLKKKIVTEYDHNAYQTNFNNNKNNYFKIRKTYINKENNPRINQTNNNNYIYSKRKNNENDFPKKILNKTEKVENFKSINLNHDYISKHLIDENYKENTYQMLLEEGKKNQFIPLNFMKNNNYIINVLDSNKNNEKINNFFERNYFNGIENLNERYNKKNNFIKNEDDDIIFLSNEEEKNNTHKRKCLSKTKNHSAYNIIFNNKN